MSRSPDGKIREKAGNELDEAEEYLEIAEKFESNLENEEFLKQNAKGSRDKAREIIEDKIKMSANHIVEAEKTLESLPESESSGLSRLEELTQKAERIAEGIDKEIEVRKHKPYS